MTTALDIVARALRKINVAHVGDTVPAEDAEDALVALNGMMSGWASKGLDYTHTTLALTDDLTTDAKHDNSIAWLLADEVASNYQRQARQDKVSEAWNMIYADLRIESTFAVDDGLLRMPSQYGRGNQRYNF